MMAGIELERRATVHEMSNQQSEKQIFPHTNLDRLGKTARYAYNFAASPCLHCMIFTVVAVQLQQWHPCEWQD